MEQQPQQPQQQRKQREQREKIERKQPTMDFLDGIGCVIMGICWKSNVIVFLSKSIMPSKDENEITTLVFSTSTCTFLIIFVATYNTAPATATAPAINSNSATSTIKKKEYNIMQ